MAAADPVPTQRVVSALLKLSKAITPGSTLTSLLQHMAESAAELVGGDRCNVMLLDDSRRYLLSKASFNLSRGEEEITFRLGEGLAGWVAEHGVPACVDECSPTDATSSSPRRRAASSRWSACR